MRVILKTVIVLMALAMVVITIGIGSLDRIVKRTVESVAPNYTQPEVTLADVTISLVDGSAELVVLTVTKPDGFFTPNAVS